MVLRELKGIFEKRRTDLINLLETNPHLDPGKQHQIYGAILEIETFLKTIDHFREHEIKEENELRMRSLGKKF